MERRTFLGDLTAASIGVLAERPFTEQVLAENSAKAKCCVVGLIMRSSSAIRNHDGFVFHVFAAKIRNILNVTDRNTDLG
jgi:hypothetical protein